MPDTQRRIQYLTQLDRFCKTSHGDNPRTDEAIENMFALMRHFDATVALVGGIISSGYRSVKVNKAVGGTRNSRHLRGLALDIIPGAPLRLEEAANLVWHAALEGRLGMVQQVIWEPTWVHVGWYSVTEADGGMNYLRKTPAGYVTVEAWRG